jgi:hypothetical protein
MNPRNKEDLKQLRQGDHEKDRQHQHGEPRQQNQKTDQGRHQEEQQRQEAFQPINTD